MDLITLAMAKAYTDQKAGYVEAGEVLTFDGNVEGKELLNEQYVKISDKVYDLSKATKVVLRMYGEDVTFGEDVLTYNEEMGGEYFMRSINVPFDGEIVPIAICNPSGTFAICFNADNYTARIEFAETIHPIDPKFLPGVCLPVVELSTDLASEKLSDEDTVIVAQAVENGMPVIISAMFSGEQYRTVATCAVGQGLIVDITAAKVVLIPDGTIMSMSQG